MGLKATTISAIEKLKIALGDLAIEVTLKKRVQDAYVPGSPVTYAETSSIQKGVITKYKFSEIDGTMIRIEDIMIIMFPEKSTIPEQNDVVLVGSKEYRVIGNDPTFVGSEIALNTVQARPV